MDELPPLSPTEDCYFQSFFRDILDQLPPLQLPPPPSHQLPPPQMPPPQLPPSQLSQPQSPPPQLPPPPPSQEHATEELLAKSELDLDSLPNLTIIVDVKVPRLKDRVPIEVSWGDTVLNLKKKIFSLNHEGTLMQPLALERIALHSPISRREMQDEQSVWYYAVQEFPAVDVDVFIRPPSSPPPQSPPQRKGKSMTVMVLPMRTKEKIPVEVNEEENVSVLKEKLEQLHQELGFRLPVHRLYFFIHNGSVMEETLPFLWHSVMPGDTIETFDGFITGGDYDASLAPAPRKKKGQNVY